MANKFEYLETVFTEIDYPDRDDNLEWWAVVFRYSYEYLPNEFAIETTYYKETIFENVHTEVMKTMSIFAIERDEAITDEQIYWMINKSANVSHEHLKSACDKLQIPVIAISCPSMVELEADLENLVNDLNIR